MVQCAYGSRPQSAAPDYVWLTWHAFTTWLAITYGRLGTIVAGFFGDSPFDVATFCAAEPTIRTAPTLAQWLLFFSLSPVDREYVEGYLLDNFRASLWPGYCECIPGVTPVWVDLYRACSTGNYSGSGALPGPALTYTVLPGDTRIQFWTYQASGCTGTQGYAFAYFMNGSGVEISHQGGGNSQYGWYPPVGTPPGGVPHYGPFTIPAGTVTINFYNFNYNPGTTSCCASAIFQVERPDVPTYTPPTPVDPTDIPDHPEVTCSTTADLCARVNALQSALLETNTNLNWLQSALAPTCWVPGTANTGLTGAGTIAVADIVGAYVTLTYPSTWGRTAETPPRSIPKVGELQWGVDGVVASEHQLHYTAEQILGAPSATNSIIYNLRTGVTASITPLQRCK